MVTRGVDKRPCAILGRNHNLTSRFQHGRFETLLKGIDVNFFVGRKAELHDSRCDAAQRSCKPWVNRRAGSAAHDQFAKYIGGPQTGILKNPDQPRGRIELCSPPCRNISTTHSLICRSKSTSGFDCDGILGDP